MKKLLPLLLLIGCAEVGDGVYSGKLVDVSWEGILYKSCEVRQQTGQVQAREEDQERASSTDRALCSELKNLVGKDVSITYKTLLWAGFSTQTRFIIQGVKVNE